MAHEDHIGDRLDHPERVPADQQHLIADDQQRVKRILEWPVAGPVLDVGCSDGAITRRIAARYPAATVWGTDLDIPTDRAPDPSLDRVAGWLQWDVRQLLVVSGDFVDAVYCCEVFEHLTLHEATLALRNICAVLKPGGDLLVTVPNRYPAMRYIYGARDRWKWPDHWQTFTAESLSDWLSPHFARLEWVPVYDEDRVYCDQPVKANESIWLMVRACGRL